MQELIDFIRKHTGGQSSAENAQDEIDVGFFKVFVLKDPSKEEFVELTKKNRSGAWSDAEPLDKACHTYIELGAWIGDQMLALRYMALAEALGLAKLLRASDLNTKDPAEIKEYFAEYLIAQGEIAMVAIEPAKDKVENRSGRSDHPLISQHRSGGKAAG